MSHHPEVCMLRIAVAAFSIVAYVLLLSYGFYLIETVESGGR